MAWGRRKDTVLSLSFHCLFAASHRGSAVLQVSCLSFSPNDAHIASGNTRASLPPIDARHAPQRSHCGVPASCRQRARRGLGARPRHPAAVSLTSHMSRSHMGASHMLDPALKALRTPPVLCAFHWHRGKASGGGSRLLCCSVASCGVVLLGKDTAFASCRVVPSQDGHSASPARRCRRPVRHKRRCLCLVFPLPFVAKTVPLPGVFPLPFVWPRQCLCLVCVPTAFVWLRQCLCLVCRHCLCVAKTVPLPCGSSGRVRSTSSSTPGAGRQLLATALSTATHQSSAPLDPIAPPFSDQLNHSQLNHSQLNHSQLGESIN